MNASGAEALILHGVRVGRGVVLGMRFDPGVHVLWGEPAEGGAELAQVLSGTLMPRRGQVRLHGQDPFADPKTRLQIASVLAEEPPLVGRTVREHVARVHELRGTPVFDDLADKAPWLSAFGERTADSLDARERRLIGTALALESPAPRLVVLHEPTLLAPELERGRLLERVSAFEDAGAIVVCITSDQRAARQIGGRIWSLSGKTSPATEMAELLVRAESPRAIAARLAEHPAVSGLHYDLASPRDLRVRGARPEPLCTAVRDALLAEKCEIYELTLLHTEHADASERGTA
jgi:ABC-type sugar transport system ATPase subunit